MGSGVNSAAVRRSCSTALAAVHRLAPTSTAATASTFRLPEEKSPTSSRASVSNPTTDTEQTATSSTCRPSSGGIRWRSTENPRTSASREARPARARREAPARTSTESAAASPAQATVTGGSHRRHREIARAVPASSSASRAFCTA